MSKVEKILIYLILILYLASLNVVVVLLAMSLYQMHFCGNMMIPPGTYVLTNLDSADVDVLERFGRVIRVEHTNFATEVAKNAVLFADVTGLPATAILDVWVENAWCRNTFKLRALVFGNLSPASLVALYERSKHVYLGDEVVGRIVGSDVDSPLVEDAVRSGLGLQPRDVVVRIVRESADFSMFYVMPPVLVLTSYVCYKMSSRIAKNEQDSS